MSVEEYRARRERLGFTIRPKPVSLPPLPELAEPPPAPVKDDPTELDGLRRELSDREMRDAAEEALLERIANTRVLASPLLGHRIARAVAKAHGLTFREMLSKRRAVRLVRARQHAMWEIKEHANLSLPQIGIILGGLDHTTVLYGIRRHQRRIDSGEVLQ